VFSPFTSGTRARLETMQHLSFEPMHYSNLVGTTMSLRTIQRPEWGVFGDSDGFHSVDLIAVRSL